MKRRINRYIASNRPDAPATVADINVRDSWAEDNDGNLFLLHANHNNINRIIVFESECCMRHLLTCSDVFLDGTFKVCSTVFDQLYVIRGPLDDSAISLVYALLPNRRKHKYCDYGKLYWTTVMKI